MGSRNRNLGAATAACIAISLMSSVSASAAEPSTTSIISSSASDTMQSSVVSIQPAPESGAVNVSYLKKRADGTWKLIAKKAAESQGSGIYVAEFAKARGRTCKLVAKFGGNDALSASKDALKISCATGRPV